MSLFDEENRNQATRSGYEQPVEQRRRSDRRVSASLRQGRDHANDAARGILESILDSTLELDDPNLRQRYTKYTELRDSFDTMIKEERAESYSDFSHLDVKEMKRMADRGYTQQEIANYFDTNKSKVQRLLAGQINPSR